MPRLPDRFDLWVRRARACAEPARQLDYVLGALLALPDWHFLNLGTREQPAPIVAELPEGKHLLVFSDADRVAEAADEFSLVPAGIDPPIISIPTEKALDWCVNERPLGSEALLLNLGEDAVAVPLDHVKAFAEEWRARGGKQAAGFWIPQLSSEEEAFWAEHGL